MKVFVWLCMALALAACAESPAPTATPVSEAQPRFSYFAVNVADADVSAAWYARAFELREVNRARSETYDIRILASDELLVELIELNPASPAPTRGARGITKVGFEITGWDARIAAWRASGVRFFNDRVLFDDALQLHNVIIQDPDGNMIQVFARSSQ